MDSATGGIRCKAVAGRIAAIEAGENGGSERT
jgi:hypothetical protein